MSTPTARLVQCFHRDLGIWEKIERFLDRAGDVSRPAAEHLAFNIDRKVGPFPQGDEVPQKVLGVSFAFARTEWDCIVYNTHGRFCSLLDPDDEACFREAFRLAKLRTSEILVDCWPRWEDQYYTSGASHNLPHSKSPCAITGDGVVVGKLMSKTSFARAYSLMIERRRHKRKRKVVDESRFDLVQSSQKLHTNLNSRLPNQQLARLGSIFQVRGTIDLSSASGCVAPHHFKGLPSRFRVVHGPSDSEDHCARFQSQTYAAEGCNEERIYFGLQSLLDADRAYGISAVYGGWELRYNGVRL